MEKTAKDMSKENVSQKAEMIKLSPKKKGILIQIFDTFFIMVLCFAAFHRYVIEGYKYW